MFWTAAWEACLTQNNLQKRGFVFCSRCYLCEEELETTIHLLLHCRYARQCQELFFNLCGISWTMPQNVRTLLNSWKHQKTHEALKQIWRTIPLCIFWTIWLERNRACFDGQKDHIFRIKNECLHNLFLWCNSSVVDSIDHYMDFMELLRKCCN